MGEGEVPAAYISKTINGIEIKFGRVVENQRINLLLPYYMKFWRHVNLAILKSPYLATL